MKKPASPARIAKANPVRINGRFIVRVLTVAFLTSALAGVLATSLVVLALVVVFTARDLAAVLVVLALAERAAGRRLADFVVLVFALVVVVDLAMH
jgi:hypothetical protein